MSYTGKLGKSVVTVSFINEMEIEPKLAYQKYALFEFEDNSILKTPICEEEVFLELEPTWRRGNFWSVPFEFFEQIYHLTGGINRNNLSDFIKTALREIYGDETFLYVEVDLLPAMECAQNCIAGIEEIVSALREKFTDGHSEFIDKTIAEFEKKRIKYELMIEKFFKPKLN